MTFTVKEICERIWELEERYGLNHMEIQGTYPWLIIRMYVYYEITRKTNVFESAQQASLSLLDKVKSFAPFIKNSMSTRQRAWSPGQRTTLQLRDLTTRRSATSWTTA